MEQPDFKFAEKSGYGVYEARSPLTLDYGQFTEEQKEEKTKKKFLFNKAKDNTKKENCIISFVKTRTLKIKELKCFKRTIDEEK